MSRAVRILFVPAVMVLAAVLAAACVPANTGGGYVTASQGRLSDLRDWQDLASEVADRVKRAVAANPEIAATPIDVLPQCSGPFCEVFAQQVASQLVSRGLQVASREEGVMALRFRAQVVGPEERASRAASESTLAMSGQGASAGSGTLELAVTSELVYQNRFLVHHTALYLVDAAQTATYGKPLPPGKPGRAPGDTGGRGVRITGE